jgi:acetyl-CoA C-acetyltransferase
VLQAGLGQNPARQAGLKAGLPETLSALTVNKVCGSGLEAVMQACRSIKAGDNRLVVAGGFENMTAAPHFARIREGVKYGPATMEDVMAYDGLRCAFECWAMTNGADHIAKKFGITRADQDRFSVQSHQRAAHAAKEGWFAAETVALTGEQCMDKRSPGVAADEGVRADTSMDSVGKLKAIPGHETITAANASQISDGAAAVLVASEDAAKAMGAKPLARIVGWNTAGVEPKELFFAPKIGIEQLLKDHSLSVKDIDLFEINEAFAAQVLADITPLGISEDKLNICGGGIALGHPIGASGARVLCTLVHQLQRTGGRRGICSLCLGGGNAVSMLIEMC